MLPKLTSLVLAKFAALIFMTTPLSDSGYKQPDGADESARPHCRTQARFVFQITENISDAKGDERYGQKVDGRLRGVACGVCHQNGGGKRGEHFKTVLLRGIGARRQALRAGEEIARISVIRAWRFPAWTPPLARK